VPYSVPWCPMATLHFLSTFTFIGMLWDIDQCRVSLPDNKQLKFLRRVDDFVNAFERCQCQLHDVERIHSSLCYISFIYIEGHSHLPSLSNFGVSFYGNIFISHFPPHSMISDLKWWSQYLKNILFFHQLTPHGPSLDLGIFTDTSTS
jgi:hypothetical protein